MTAKEYIDEVKLRLPRNIIEKWLNDARLLTFINRARRDAQRATISVYPERYGMVELVPLAADSKDNSLSVDSTLYNFGDLGVYSFPLPQTMIECIQVNLHFEISGVTYRRECRNATKKELFNTMVHSWNRPTTISPVYVIEKKLEDESSGRGTGDWCYLIGLQYGRTQTLFDVATNIKAQVWYTAALNDLTLASTYYNKADDDDVTMPPNIEELVINTSILYALQSVNIFEEESVTAYIEMYKKSIRNMYEIEEIIETHGIPSQEGFPE